MEYQGTRDTQLQANLPYVIPDYEPAMRRWRKVWWLVPACVALSAVVGYSLQGAVVTAITLGMYALVPGFILVAIILFPVVGRFHKLEQAKYEEHNFTWYCTAFPSHAPGPGGKLRCRHCGSDRMRTENMMRHSYRRIHSCGQCGETLYYSREKR